MSTRAETDLDNCRAVVYTFGPAGRKGSKKCTAACGWYFIPDMVEYPFHDVDALDTKGLVYLTGEQWYAETSCCPNCEPENSTVKYGWRRNLGYRFRADKWRKSYGNAYEWFPIENRYNRRQEARGRNRRQYPAPSSEQPSRMRTQILEKGARIAKGLGRTPTHTEFTNNGLDTRSTVQIFGNYRNFVIELGLEPRQPGQHTSPDRVGCIREQQYSDRELRRLLREAMRRAGHTLTMQEWNEEIGHPRAQMIAKRLGGGSYRRACTLVGIKPNPYREFPRWAIEKAFLARGLNPDEVGKKPYEILNDPDSDYNRMRREVEYKVEEHYLPEALEAQERWEQGKFKKREDRITHKKGVS